MIVGLVSLPTDQFYVEVPEAAFLLLTGGQKVLYEYFEIIVRFSVPVSNFRRLKINHC